MRYPLPVSEEWVPCGPMFVETDDGFTLTDEALALLDPPDPAASSLPSVLDRIAAVRAELAALAVEMPAAVRLFEPAELLDSLEALQEATNMLGSLDQAVVAEIDRSDAFVRCGHTSTSDLLSQLLRIRPSEAKRRVFTARVCAQRVGLDGAVLPPLRPIVAAAQASGRITTDHAHTIARALDWLPVGLPVETVDDVEATLVELAGKRNASDVAELGRAARDMFDPDGPEPRDEQQHRRRGLTLTQDDDGAGRVRGDLTAGLLAKLQAVLSPLAAPRPDDANGPDTRTYPVRLHDALEDLCDRFLRSGKLPASGGVPATVAVTIPFSQLQAQTGRVTTTLGVDLSFRQFLQVACEAEIIPVFLNDAGGVMAYGRKKRFATAQQTKALWARDRGCSFPGCTRPPEWCERHHVQEWIRDHGPTDIDQLTLACGYHHRNFETWGWRVEMRDGVPWWIPPPDIDPDQKPLQNQAHLTLA